MAQESSRIYLKVILVLEQTSKVMLGPKTEFSFILKTLIFSFRHKLALGVSNLEIHLVEYVHMDHTDHLGVRPNLMLICKFKSTNHVWRTDHFLRLL